MNQSTASQLLLAFGLLLASPLAHAQADAADAERASAFVSDAKKAFSEGRTHDALRAFRDAWALEKTPEIAANLGIIEAKFGQHRDAAEHFHFALSHLSTAATDDQKQAIAAGLAAEKREVVTLTIDGSPIAAKVSIDGVETPMGDEVYVTAGSHTLVAALSGYQSATVPIDSFAGNTFPVAFSLKPVAVDLGTIGAASPPVQTISGSAHAAHRPSFVPVFIGGGIAVVGVALGTVFWLKAGNAEDTANTMRSDLPPGNSVCGSGTPYGPKCQALHQANVDVDKNRNLAVVGFVVGGAAAASTLAYWLWPRSSSGTLPEASAFVAPGRAELRARWAW